jgi:hypothetical protein
MFQEFNNVSIEYISSSVPIHSVGNSFSTLLTEKEIKVLKRQLVSKKEGGQIRCYCIGFGICSCRRIIEAG